MRRRVEEVVGDEGVALRLAGLDAVGVVAISIRLPATYQPEADCGDRPSGSPSISIAAPSGRFEPQLDQMVLLEKTTPLAKTRP